LSNIGDEALGWVKGLSLPLSIHFIHVMQRTHNIRLESVHLNKMTNTCWVQILQKTNYFFYKFSSSVVRCCVIPKELNSQPHCHMWTPPKIWTNST